MMDGPFNTDIAQTRKLLEQIARRGKDLPASARQLIDEALEVSSSGMEQLMVAGEELQVATEELRHQNEELLAAREVVEAERRRYRDLFEFAPDGYLVTDPAGIIQEANQSAVRLLGIPRMQLQGKPLILYAAPGEWEEFHRYLDRLAGEHEVGTKAAEWETYFQSRGRGEFPAALTAAPIRDKAGELTGLRWLLRDISASKRAEERERLLVEVQEQRRLAEEANRLMQAVIETMPVGAIIADGDGHILNNNVAARGILGSAVWGIATAPERDYTTHYPDGTPISPEDMPLMHALREGQTSQDAELLIRRADGEERILLVSAAPVRNEAGKIISAVVIFRDVTEYRRLMDELEAERARLKAIIDNVPLAIVVADQESRVVLTNPTADKLYNRPVPFGQSIDSHASLRLCYPDGRPYDARDLPLTRSALDSETTIGLEMAIEWPDGQRRDLLVNSAPIRDDKGQPQGAIGAFQDITERKATQRTLELYAERLLVLHAADQIVLNFETAEDIADAILSFLGRLVHWEQANILTFDREKGEAALLSEHSDGEIQAGKGTRIPLDRQLLSELAPDGIDIVEDHSILDALPALTQALRAEGVRSVVSVPLVAHGELLGLVNMGFDGPAGLSDERRESVRQVAGELAIGLWQARLLEELRHHSEHLEQTVAQRTSDLRSSEARFRTIYEASVVGIALLNREGQILTANPAFQDMLGYSEEELCETALAVYLPAENAGADAYQTLVSGKLESYQDERLYTDRDGRNHWAELTVSHIQGVQGNRRRFAIALVQDITEKKLNQEALLRTERLAIAGRLGASLAHEINNPLQAVIGCLGLAEEMLDDGAGARRYLAIATEELERAAGIVTQLRDLSRTVEPHKEPADLNALVEKVLMLTRKQCQNQSVEVVWSPAARMPAVALVPSRIQQVFLNLVLNAIEAMPAGGRLQVRTAHTRKPEGVRVTLSDTGMGIEPGRLDQIFEPFHSTQPDGMGLGLYVTKKIVEEHKGRIEVKSHVGKGTTFTIWLPR